MPERFNHTYTQLLVICVLAFVTKDAPWWTMPAVIVTSSALAVLFEVLRDRLKGK